MTDGGVPGRRAGTAHLPLALLAAALAVVVVGTVAGAPEGDTTLVDPNHLGPRLVLLAIVLTAVVGLVLFAFSSRRPWVRVLAVLAALLLTGVVVALLESPPVVEPPPTPVLEEPTTEPSTVTRPAADPSLAPDVAWGTAVLDLGQLLLAASILIAVGALAWLAGTWLGERLFGWHRAPRPTPARAAAAPGLPMAEGAERLRSELADEIDRTLVELPLDGDPRTVVLAAYVRMTDLLADHGVERRASDTPLEYLGRTLEALDTDPGPVQHLTASFEEAMFSTHPIGADGAAAAVTAFEDVRDALRTRDRV